jgi:signal transduction histidine kinase
MTAIPESLAARRLLPLRFLAGVLIVLLAALALFYVVLRPPASDLRAMALFLAITATVSLVVGYAAYRGGWLSRLPRLGWTLLGIYALSSVLTFLNVWLTARLMFASEHDLLLATVLLVFAGGIAMVLGYFLSADLTDRIRGLSLAARKVAAGRLNVRVPVAGRDEVAELARTFNDMSAQLAGAAQKQRELDALRRDLIAWAGHDLRTPLASVRAIVEALADDVVDDPAERQRYLRTAQRDIQALSALIDDLFELTQLDTGGLKLEMCPASLADLVSDTLESFSALAREQGVVLRGSAAPGVDPVTMDSSKIGRVLANLLSNALRHTPAGGAVEVRAWPAGGEVFVSVQDTGPGISPEDLPHVFERFYRGEKSRSRASGGSGLGLAIAEGIVAAHGGRIWAVSAAGAGATLTFALPGSPPR